MGKLLCSIKICLLEKHIETLPPGTVVSSAQQASKIRSFTNFATFIYSQWWLTCPSAADALWNDLELYKNLSHYSLYDKHVSNSALKALRRHLWYLTEEMVPLAPFCDVTPSEEKRTIFKGLLKKFGTHSGGTDAPTKCYGSDLVKPKFPEHLEPTSRLCNFTGEDSWYFFKLLDLDPRFLQILLKTGMKVVPSSKT